MHHPSSPPGTPTVTPVVVSTPTTGETFTLTQATSRSVGSFVVTLGNTRREDDGCVRVPSSAGPEQTVLHPGDSHAFPGVGTITALSVALKDAVPGPTGGGPRSC